MSNSDLVKRCKASVEDLIACTEFAAHSGRFAAIEYIEVAGGCAAYHGPNAMLTYGVGIGSLVPASDNDIAITEGFYKSRGSRSIALRTWAYGDATVHRILDCRGYAYERLEQDVWRSLSSFSSDVTSATNGQIEISIVKGDEAEFWARIACEVFDDPRPESYISLGFARGCSAYLARWEGEPAGVAVSSIRSKVLLLRTGGTRRKFRKRGIQAALIDRRLRDAADAGCELAVSGGRLDADGGAVSLRNLQRSGFVPLGRTIWRLRQI